MSFDNHYEQVISLDTPIHRYSVTPTHLHSDTSSSFTLIELMVVVAIIAILVGLIVPTFFAVREQVKISKVRSDVKHLETALKAYIDHYKEWPDSVVAPDESLQPADGYAVEDKLYKILRGDDEGDDNPNKIAFFEFEKAPVEAADPDAAYDPWDGPFLPYRVKFDLNFDNKIDYGGTEIYRSVLAWSVGPDRAERTDDDIRSWE